MNMSRCLWYEVRFRGEHGDDIGVTTVSISAEDLKEWALAKDKELGPILLGEEVVGFRKNGQGRLTGMSIVKRVIPVGYRELEEIAIVKARAKDLEDRTCYEERATTLVAVRIPS